MFLQNKQEMIYKALDYLQRYRKGPGGVESTRKNEIKTQIQINVAFELQ